MQTWQSVRSEGKMSKAWTSSRFIIKSCDMKKHENKSQEEPKKQHCHPNYVICFRGMNMEYSLAIMVLEISFTSAVQKWEEESNNCVYEHIGTGLTVINMDCGVAEQVITVSDTDKTSTTHVYCSPWLSVALQPPCTHELVYQCLP